MSDRAPVQKAPNPNAPADAGATQGAFDVSKLSWSQRLIRWCVLGVDLILSPSRWPATGLSLLGLLLKRAVILVYIAILTLLIARSSNLQVIGVFSEMNSVWVQFFTTYVVAITAGLLFGLRRPLETWWAVWADGIVYALPVFIIMFLPPWGAVSFPGFAAALLSQLGLMVFFYFRPIWDQPDQFFRGFFMIIGAFIVVFVLVWLDPVGFGRTFGVAFMGTLFLGLLALGVATLLRAPEWAFALLVWIVFAFSSSFEFAHEAEYHPLPDFPAADTAAANPFALWLFDRPDAAYYRDNNLPYPVFIAASEGGGGYAKAHAYAFLSKMTERCPNFAQHLFALVGVSGGQIGNTMYHAHLDAPEKTDMSACRVSSLERHADYLAVDHLSPLVAQLLFVETPRKLFLWGEAEKNRTEVLTDSFNDGGNGYGPIPDIPFRGHFWRYDLDGTFAAKLTGKPALVSVTVNVQTGNRYVFSPFRFDTRGESHLDVFRGAGDMFDGITDLRDPALHSAALASASFPWVTPSLRFSFERAYNQYRDQPQTTPDGVWQEDGPDQAIALNLVDGGYFENTGAETLSEIVADLGAEGAPLFLQCNDNPEAIHFGVDDDYPIRAFGGTSPCLAEPSCTEIRARYVQFMQPDVVWGPCEVPFFLAPLLIRNEMDAPESGTPQNFIQDPVNAILNARSARGSLAIGTLEERKCGFQGGASPCGAMIDFAGSGQPHPHIFAGILQSRIHAEAMALPLGWHMPLDRMEMLDQMVVPDAALCEEVGISFTEQTEIYDFLPSSDFPPELDLLLKQNCSHLRQLALYFDADALQESMAWRP